MKKLNKPGRWMLGVACVSGWSIGVGALSPQSCLAQAGAANPAAATTPKADPKHVLLIFRDGHTLKGEVTAETPTVVKLKGKISGIDYETEFQKADILDIKRGVALDDAPPSEGAPPGGPTMAASSPPASTDGKLKYYWMDLEGQLGEQITQTPIREAVADAKKESADIIIMSLKADLPQQYPSSRQEDENKDKESRFDEMFRAEQIVPIFAEEIPREWSKKPRVVVWVKQAMAGAAFLPLIVPEIYFSSDGRLGGLGDLSHLFDGVGDDVVRAKQKSLRLGHAEGWAIQGGYDYRLVRAMARVEYVLSVRFVNGKPELFEGYPQNPGEELLTDDGKDANEDTLEQKVAGTGNDVLTFNATVAKKLGLSKGTVDSKDDLLIAMGIDRSAVEDSGRSKAIFKSWDDRLDQTKRRIRNLLDDYRRVQVGPPGDYAARTKARGRRMTLLNELKGAITGPFKEGLSPLWLGINQIPGENQINIRIEEIKVEQQKDKK